MSGPYYFGMPEARLFGYYHAPTAAASPHEGVLLCNPCGHEYMAAHRTMRQTALRLARAGAAALRFDYFGAGDSAGSSEEGCPSRWLADVAAAAAELRKNQRAPDISAIGMRLGATLAYLHFATAREDARGLVLWDPIVDGRAYVAELKELQQTRFGPGDGEVLGVPFTAALQAEIAGIDLCAASLPRAARVLIVETGPGRDETRALVARLADGGVAVEHRSFPLAPLWHEPNKSTVHAVIVQAVVQWTTAPVFSLR